MFTSHAVLNKHHHHLNTAFLQLSFAIKLLTYLENHPIVLGDFDIDLSIRSLDGIVGLPHNEFPSYGALLIAAENNVSIAFGVASISLWEAIREHNCLESRDLRPDRSAKENLASFSYMLRCCFAHGTAWPTWRIGGKKYRTIYQIFKKSVDLTNVEDGAPFSYDSIGGYETLWTLRSAAESEQLV